MLSAQGDRHGHPDTDRPEHELGGSNAAVGRTSAGLAVADGSVWVADPGTRSVVRVDAETNRVVARIKVGARPGGIAAGDGLVWVAVG